MTTLIAAMIGVLAAQGVWGESRKDEVKCLLATGISGVALADSSAVPRSSSQSPPRIKRGVKVVASPAVVPAPVIWDTLWGPWQLCVPYLRFLAR